MLFVTTKCPLEGKTCLPLEGTAFLWTFLCSQDTACHRFSVTVRKPDHLRQGQSSNGCSLDPDFIP